MTHVVTESVGTRVRQNEDKPGAVEKFVVTFSSHSVIC